MSASRRSGTTDELGPPEPGRDGGDLLAALLDGMDAALCALDADGAVTHWNKEAERILGWTAAEAVGRPGFAGWAVRSADAEEVQSRLLSAMRAPGRQVHEFALLTKDGGRVLVRTQSAAVRGPDGRPAGVYCAFSEVHAQIDLERSIALSEALFDDAAWGVVLVDADLRPAVVNGYAARALGTGRTALLGRPLGELLAQGVEELESALTHVLAEGAPPSPAEMWVTLRTAGSAERRRCWRSGFVRLASPLTEEPVPLGVGWLFQDVTEAKQTAQEAAQLRFRANQLHRAAHTAAECEDPAEAASLQLDFALAGFADHALLDLLVRGGGRATGGVGSAGAAGGTGRAGGEVRAGDGGAGAGGGGVRAGSDAGADAGDAGAGGAAPAGGGVSAGRAGGAEGEVSAGRGASAAGGAHADGVDSADGEGCAADAGGPGRAGGVAGGEPAVRLVRAVTTPSGEAGPSLPAGDAGLPVRYAQAHPAVQCVAREGTVRTSAAPQSPGRGAARGAGHGSGSTQAWAGDRQWPEDTVHALCTVLRSRGRTLGVATFLRGASRPPFDRADAMYAESVAARVAAALDLSQTLDGGSSTR